MARFEGFERDLKLATAGMEPAAISAALAKYARAELAKAIAAGASPQYDRYVNGVAGLPEESVVAPGSILYVFSNWPLVINAALAELVKRSPRKSGRFAASFIVIVNGAPTVEYSKIPSDGEVLITNFQPYVRKVEGGLSGVKRRRVFDGTKSVMNSRFRGAFTFEAKYLDISAGVHPMIPYILKRGSRRKDRQAGMPISYPSIIINAL